MTATPPSPSKPLGPPPRSEVDPADRWDLSSLYAGDAQWEAALPQWDQRSAGYEPFRGGFDNPQQLAQALRFQRDHEEEGDRLGAYAMLRYSEDQADPVAQSMRMRFMDAAARAAEASSFLEPQILALPEATLRAWIDEPELAEFRLYLQRLLRLKPHTLSPEQERLLAMGMKPLQGPRQIFQQLNDADLRFGQIEVDGQTRAITHASFRSLMEHPAQATRAEAFGRYYAAYQQHANTLAAALESSMQRDVFLSRARDYQSARQAAMRPNHVPEEVYDRLIEAIRSRLSDVHRYYELRRRVMGLEALHYYDTYADLKPQPTVDWPWDKAVETVIEALAPLGEPYAQALAEGLRGGWVDRYENLGKRSGAFSGGAYHGDPYILMNYRSDSLDQVFTLAHEAGHSMHSWHSNRAQPYQYAGYTIFVAEVASTFNEQLLGRLLMQRAKDDPGLQAVLINRELEGLRNTMIRQTMFAEFELSAHRMIEKGEPLTLDAMRKLYRSLLEAYLGPGMVIDEALELECLRIPHFYRAFYVYQYATGIAAAIALAERVLSGGQQERDDYLKFLSGGSSQDPLDLLREAGVDMSSTQPVHAAMDRFASLTDELEALMSDS